MIIENIDKYYLEKDKDREKTKFYISEVGKCPRSIYFKFKKVPKRDKEARVLRIFHQGDFIHLRLMSVLYSCEDIRIVAGEVEIPPQKIISGRADAILEINNENYVLDIKSMRGYAFKILKEPKLEHIMQVQLYMHFFNIKNGILLYECKDTQELKEFTLNYNKKLVEDALENLKKLKEQIDNNITPDIPKNLEDWQCEYCEYREECAKLESEKIKNFSEQTDLKKYHKT